MPVRMINIDKQTLLNNAKALKDSFPELAEWDFDNPNDVIRFMLDTYFGSLETAGAWANALAQEFNIATATARDNVIQHALQLGYVPTNRVAAEVDLTITHNPIPSNITVPAHRMRVSAQGREGEKVWFENKENFTLLAGQEQLEGVPFIQGRTIVTNHTSRAVPFQTFTLNDHVVHESVIVEVDGQEWDEVDTFALLDSDSERYRLRLISDRVYQIIFGDGTRGRIPGTGADITIRYLRGGGLNGNVAPETISSIDENPLPDVITEVINPDRATGGTNPESMEAIRNSAIRVPRMNNRLVSTRDIEAFAEAYDGVARAQAMSNFTSPIVYIIPDGGGAPSSGLISDLQNDMNRLIVMGYFASVLAPQYVSVDLHIRIVINPAFRRSVVETNVREELEKILDPLHRFPNGLWAREFGDPLKVSEVAATVRNVEGVMAVEIQSPTPTPGSDTLVNVNQDQIIDLETSNINIQSIVSREHEATNNKSIKALFANPRFRIENEEE